LKILLLAPAPGNISPSQRFRFEHYIKLNNNNELKFNYASFLSTKSWAILHLKNHYFQKGLGIMNGFLKRWALLLSLHQYDWIYIHREAAPVGPPIFEWLIAKVWRKKIIYDFDDAIWVSAASEANPGVAALKCTWKVANICRMSHIVTVGNKFLADYAQQFCKDVRLIPTVVDTEGQHNRIKDQNQQPLTIGWTGTFTNFYNLYKITPVITALHKKYDFQFLVIADKDPCFTDVEYRFKKWNVTTEIHDLIQLHIGLMPLENSEVEKGKCAFKAIQYMSLGVPAVVSPVGANMQVISNNVHGFWAESENEWYQHLETLLLNHEMRYEMGKVAREHIIANYSVRATKKMFSDLFVG